MTTISSTAATDHEYVLPGNGAAQYWYAKTWGRRLEEIFGGYQDNLAPAWAEKKTAVKFCTCTELDRGPVSC